MITLLIHMTEFTISNISYSYTINSIKNRLDKLLHSSFTVNLKFVFKCLLINLGVFNTHKYLIYTNNTI